MDRYNVSSVFAATEIIETERLILRKMKVSDAKDMFEYACDSEVTKYLPWEPHSDAGYTKRYLGSVERAYGERKFFDFAVVLKATGKMIGTCGFTSFDYLRASCEVGYVLNPRYRGYELMPEAVLAVMDFAFEKLGAKVIKARFMDGNVASLRVMEKCGMTFDGFTPDAMVVRGKSITVGTCSITENTYRMNIKRR